jgi:hypothetical protein
MINPVASSYASNVNQLSQSAARQPQQAQSQQSASLPQDTVSLKSAGDVDHDGDSR